MQGSHLFCTINSVTTGVKTNCAATGCDALGGRVQFGGRLDDVFEAEGAVAGQPLALAPAAQVLPVGPLWVNVALRSRAGTTHLVAPLERKKKKKRAG